MLLIMNYLSTFNEQLRHSSKWFLIFYLNLPKTSALLLKQVLYNGRNRAGYSGLTLHEYHVKKWRPFQPAGGWQAGWASVTTSLDQWFCPQIRRSVWQLMANSDLRDGYRPWHTGSWLPVPPRVTDPCGYGASFSLTPMHQACHKISDWSFTVHSNIFKNLLSRWSPKYK